MAQNAYKNIGWPRRLHPAASILGLSSPAKLLMGMGAATRRGKGGWGISAFSLYRRMRAEI